MKKDINIKTVYLFDENPRFSLTKDSLERMKSISEEDLTKENEISTAKKLMKYEGDFSDLFDLINSIYSKGYREKANPFIMIEISPSKYVVADGNRRLLALKILSRVFDLEEIIPKEYSKVAKHYLDSIREILNGEIDKNIANMEFLYSHSYGIEKIDEMLIDINLNHTGSGNGKRIWPRGKMLLEFYDIYIKANNHDDAIEQIVELHGVTKKKAKSDIPSAIFCNEIFNEYKRSNPNSKLELINLAPSALELIKSTRFPDEITFHEENKENHQNLGKLFNLQIIDGNDGKKFLDKKSIKYVSFETLSNLLIKGYAEYEALSQNEDEDILIKELENEFEDNKEKENAENSGLLKNTLYTTRSWTTKGNFEIYDLLNWPTGNTIEKKIDEIIIRPEKMIKLSIEDAKEIISKSEDSIRGKPYYQEIKKAIEISESARELSSEGTEFFGDDYSNHLYKVISIIDLFELKKLRIELQRLIFPIKESDIASQLGTLRTLYELTVKFIIYLCISLIEKYVEDIQIKDFVENIESSSAANLKPNATIEEWIELLYDFKVITQFSHLPDLFEKTKRISGNKLINGVQHMYLDKIWVLISPMLNQDEKNIYGKFRKVISNFEEKYKLLGEKISIPMHHIEKYITEYKCESIAEFNNQYREIFDTFNKLWDYINSNREYFIFDDDDLKKYLDKQIKLMKSAL